MPYQLPHSRYVVVAHSLPQNRCTQCHIWVESLKSFKWWWWLCSHGNWGSSSYMGLVVKSLSLSMWWQKSLKSSYVAVVEGRIPCSTIVLEGLLKMEVSPSPIGGRLVGEDVDVGELMGSRQRCRTSKGEDDLIALGKDAEVVVVAVPPSWWCLFCGLLLCS